jgi:6-phosphofructokinase
VVLSGGQAAGGHNVIAGLFDYVAAGHPHSKLYGFIGTGVVATHIYQRDDDALTLIVPSSSPQAVPLGWSRVTSL